MDLDFVEACVSPNFPKNWRKGKELGSGAFGKVFLVIDDDDPSDEKFVVKEVEIDKVYKDRNQEINELKALVQIKHKGITPFYGFHPLKDTLLIFLQYRHLGSIAKRIERDGCLQEEIVRNYTRQILDALNYLHTRNPPIIHRYIKGRNILLVDETNIEITDFGISKVLSSQTNARSQVGTINYMAPEIVLGEKTTPYSVKADIWSVGCTVVEMITKYPPFHGMRDDEIFSALKNAEPLNYTLPNDASGDLKSFLSKTFQTDIQHRPTAQQLLSEDQFLKLN
ncbi:mitogen-activated protein kinase kinase kinase 2-like [Physella acuta]|uniref:mitogen-activated protein kinase kinase kinase 2-like n=1 Tax=Physella acuta TaxID=109671 RepID=UPI0027DC21FE|nr:mitogen-activated protein kinase kinase kinase 2-like [Physella acuta]